MSEVLRPIFIASNSFDRDVYEPVTEHLQARGHEVITYEADKVANGEIDMAIHIGASACRITYDSKIIETDNIGAAWLRRPTMFGAKRPGEDTAFRRSIDSERRAAQSIVFDMIPEERWLNSPAATSRAQEKLQQLVLAQSLGFTIPETVVSNQWDTILDKLHYGAFDFCEDDNALTFLEMNPSGQYYWLETELGLPLSATIADKLSQIATR
jgi:glutathione synthase/RimK-type ligase-like ATP-grasp enzyme